MLYNIRGTSHENGGTRTAYLSSYKDDVRSTGLPISGKVTHADPLCVAAATSPH